MKQTYVLIDGRLYSLDKEVVFTKDTDGLVPAPSTDEKLFLQSDGTWAPITIKDCEEMVGATEIENGEAGLVPPPLAGDNNKFLSGDGTWNEINSIPLETVINELNK